MVDLSRNFYAYSQFELYFTLIVGAISVLGLALAASTWLYSPSLASPSDIMLVIVLGTLIDNLSLYVEASMFFTTQSTT
jgi:hypothetical protein